MPAPPPRAPGMPLAEWALAALAALALLVALRPVTVHAPYWWDAAAVYVPGAKWLTEHGFDARPGVFPSDLGRGHTAGFYLILAAGFRFFGATPAVGHAIVLGFSAVALATTYALGRLLGGRLAGAAAMLLLAASPLYLTMSSEALPEVPVTALTVVGLYAFARGRYVACALWGCALLALKELSVAGPLAAVGALVLAGLRARRVPWRDAALLSVPLAPLAGFFVWQRVAEGWWILPYHAALFNESHSYAKAFARVAGSIATADGRWLALAAAPVAAWATRRDAGAPGTSPSRGTTQLALALVVAANVVFYTRGWFLERYALPAHAALVALLASAFNTQAPGRGRRAALAAVTAAAFALGVSRRWSGDDYASGETTFRYVRAMEAQRAVFRELAARAPGAVVMTTWPMSAELREPYLGWTDRAFRVVNLEYLDPHAPPPAVDAVVTFDALGSHPRLVAEARRRGFRVLHAERRGGATVAWWGP